MTVLVADHVVMRKMAAAGRHRSRASWADILAAASRREDWACRALYDAHSASVTAFVRSRASEDVDDIVNEIFLGAFTGLPRFEGDEAGFKAWLFRIARNKINDHHRRRHRRVQQTPLGSTDSERQPSGDGGEFELGESSDEVTRILQVLTDDQREVILLRVIADLSIEQVAEIMDKPAGAIKALQHRAIEALGRHLGSARSTPGDVSAQTALSTFSSLDVPS